MRRHITLCPVCEGPLHTTELSCTRCPTRLQGDFPASPLALLSDEHQTFVETFVRCRGVIRDVERALGISYPTVRARLDGVVLALEEKKEAETPIPPPSPAATKGTRARRRAELLRQVQAGTLSTAAAAAALREL